MVDRFTEIVKNVTLMVRDQVEAIENSRSENNSMAKTIKPLVTELNVASLITGSLGIASSQFGTKKVEGDYSPYEIRCTSDHALAFFFCSVISAYESLLGEWNREKRTHTVDIDLIREYGVVDVIYLIKIRYMTFEAKTGKIYYNPKNGGVVANPIHVSAEIEENMKRKAAKEKGPFKRPKYENNVKGFSASENYNPGPY